MKLNENWHMSRYYRVLFILVFIIAVCYNLYYMNYQHKIKITAVFNEIELNSKHLSVYYKGFKIGRIIKLYLSDNGKTTSLDMILNMKNLTLPDNITAKIKTRNKKDYIELIYPKNPSEFNLQNKDIIQGNNCFDINAYINKQVDSGGLDEIKTNFNNTVIAAGETLDALTGLIITGDEILKDLKPSLKESGYNLAKSSENLRLITAKLNNSMDSPKVKNCGFNIEQATKNIESATKNLNLTTENLNIISEKAKLQTMLLFKNINKASNNLIFITEQLKCLIKNCNDIILGIKTTLSQKFSGFKIMFGKTVQQ